MQWPEWEFIEPEVVVREDGAVKAFEDKELFTTLPFLSHTRHC
jgi:hypothetical protein